MREALGDDNFELLSRAGAKLSYDDAVDLALRVIPTQGIRPGKTASPDIGPTVPHSMMWIIGRAVCRPELRRWLARSPPYGAKTVVLSV